MRLLSALLIILSVRLALATLSVESISGVSYAEVPAEGETAVFNVYGGMIKDAACNSNVSAGLCNSCTDTVPPLKSCNAQGVYPNQIITVTLKSSTALSSVNYRVFTNGVTSSDEASSEASNGTLNVSANQTFSVTLDWAYLCNADANFANTSCTPTSPTAEQVSFANQSRKIMVYVDENKDGDYDDSNEKVTVANVEFQYINPTAGNIAITPNINQQDFCPLNNATTNHKGACYYDVLAGDGKFYIDQIDGNFAKDTGAPEWYGLMLYAAPGANITTAAQNAYNGLSTKVLRTFKSDPSEGETELFDRTISGLTNYQDYCLIVGNVNKAQNIIYANTKTPSNTVCTQPSEVVGMLTDKSCFISTAAFGSDMAPQVNIFREFRNRYLIPTAVGRTVVKAYYKYSPFFAQGIAHSPYLRAATRLLLYPWLGFSWLAIHFGLGLALLSLISGCVLIVVSIQSMRKRFT